MLQAKPSVMGQIRHNRPQYHINQTLSDNMKPLVAFTIVGTSCGLITIFTLLITLIVTVCKYA